MKKNFLSKKLLSVSRRAVVCTVIIAAISIANAIHTNQSKAADELVWGVSMPLTGPFAKAGQLGEKGIRAFLGYTNATGGINGKQIKLLAEDSGYVPDKALAFFKQLMASDEKPVVFYGDSTGFSKLVAPELNDRYQILVGGTSFSTDLTNEDDYPFQFMPGPSYADQIGILLEYIAQNSSGTNPKVALFYSNTEFGRDPIESAKTKAKSLGIEIVEEIETKPAGVDVAPEVIKLRRAKPDYVIFHGFVTSVWPEVMKQALQSGVKAMFMGTFWAMEPAIIKQMGPLADYYMGVFPYRYYYDQAESKTLQTMAAVTKEPYLPTYFIQTWFSGMIFAETIKRTLDAGKPLTGQNLKAAFNSLQNWDTGGLIGIPVNVRNNSIPIGRIYKGDSATGALLPVSDWIELK
ncbi:MAG: amino acid ABC transporter substrate-binding protein [Alphaproteobacteria bacterium]|nr:amino acid ABC transporter substrate-binding protein [Alphaproteobacteria bacterium]|tara:strand:+ start:663 stop:1880 length:1218 start_codon:yes stop_codon:yes gene_type:complete